MLDLNALKLKPKGVVIKTAPLLNSIRTQKPDNTDFFRIRPGDEWMMEFPIFSSKGTGKDKEKYLVMPDYQQELEERNSLQLVRFYYGILWGSNVLFLSDVSIKCNEDGEMNSYHKSRHELYELAKTKWISISANTNLGAYTATEAKSLIPDPTYPLKPGNIEEAIQIAFKDNVIDKDDHPVLKRLRGEI